jgi:hypothetical protein
MAVTFVLLVIAVAIAWAGLVIDDGLGLFVAIILLLLASVDSGFLGPSRPDVEQRP